MEKRTVRTGNKRYLMHCVRICVPLCRLRRMSGSPWWRATACNDYISLVFCIFFRNGFRLFTKLLTSIDGKSPTFHSYAGAKHFEMFAFYWFVTMPYSSSSVDALVRGMQGEKKWVTQWHSSADLFIDLIGSQTRRMFCPLQIWRIFNSDVEILFKLYNQPTKGSISSAETVIAAIEATSSGANWCDAADGRASCIYFLCQVCNFRSTVGHSGKIFSTVFSTRYFQRLNPQDDSYHATCGTEKR